MTSKTFTVLIADDDEYIRFPLKVFLEHHEIRVVEVSDPQGVLLHAAEVDALIIDARLPKADEGIVVAGKLVNEARISTTTPIVFISNSQEHFPAFQRSLSLPALNGRYVWLRKPFESELLLQTLKEERTRLAGRQAAAR